MRHTSFRIIIFVFLFCFFRTFSYSQDYTLPSNFYEANCVFESTKFDMSISERYRSAVTDVSTYFPAVVGDINGDGFGEIVIPGGEHNKHGHVYILNHKAELIKKIVLPDGATMNTNDDSVVLADLDNDGKGEIIVTASNGKKLFVFDYNGDLITSVSYPSAFPKTIGVADFNQDGIPEIYVGTRIYSLQNRNLILLADGGNAKESTVAQDVLTSDRKRIPELVSVDGVYKVSINSLVDPSLNAITKVILCGAISTISTLRERTFALADIDLDGSIDVVTVVPIGNSPKRLEVKVWSTQTGAVKYTLDIKMDDSINTSIRNSWPFIGDTDANGYPDIIFMGGLARQGHTAVYRLEYDKGSNTLKERARNSSYKDYSSMSTSMSMFDFNNDGKQEVVYRDEIALYILNGETLNYEPGNKIDNCFSGTGWEYPVVVSLTPSGESSVLMSSSDTPDWPANAQGTLRIYGADAGNGNKPWMPARRVWNQYSYYQNMIQDDLTTISKPALLNEIIRSTDGTKTMQPFNGHMFQLGIIRPSSLISVYPLADIEVDMSKTTYGFNHIGNELKIDFELNNIGDAPMDPNIAIEVFKYESGVSTSIYSELITNTFYPGDQRAVSISISDFKKYYPFDSLKVEVARGKYDCDASNNRFVILPEEISGVLYVKKGSTGKGLTWENAMGELSDALVKAELFNIRYPHSLTQIWVAEGTYYGNFVMQEGVNVYGGFRGFEQDVEQSRPLVFPTIIDAQRVGRPLTQTQNFSLDTEWRGFILQNGKTVENGGGVFLLKGATLSHSAVRHNITTEGYGGGVYALGGRLINNVIEYNSSLQGGGIYATDSSIITNNTIVKNTSKQEKGGGLYANISSVANNIVYGNMAGASVDNIFASGGSVHNNMADNTNAIDPLFVNYAVGEYSLLPISLAINAGDNTAIAGYKTDITGESRIYENKLVDLGAFEYQGIKMVLSKEGYFYVNNKKDGDGASWENATKELANALASAKLINDSKPNSVKRIWVAAGTYNGTFEMVEGTAVRGGFAGDEVDFDLIDTLANKTYLNAQNLGRVITQPRDFEVATEWAGFIIQGGKVEAVDRDVYGGGAYLRKNGSIRYSTIRNNSALAIGLNNKVNAYGGGVYMQKGADLTSVTIDGNTAKVEVYPSSTVAYGVAQGGGVYNEINRLAYLVVRRNATLSSANTDGAAIYTTGGVINSIVDHNNGKSAIYIAEDQVIVNSTIADNTIATTIVGELGSKLRNSIVYNNTTTSGDFANIEYINQNNLIGIDPLFGEDSYKQKSSSPASGIGQIDHFPSDLKLDIEGRQRYIGLKNSVKVIDAGAYQLELKVKSATATTITVPFGTKFENLNLIATIEGLVEGDYAFDCSVDWGKGRYNEMLPGSYTLDGRLSNLPDGVVNPDDVLGAIVVIVKKNHISDLEDLTINGENWLPNCDIQYNVNCENTTSTKLPLTLRLPHFATVEFVPNVEYDQEGNDISLSIDVSRPGSHLLTVKVTSQDEKSTTTYPLNIVKFFPFWEIIEQRWNNTFVINNNKENNGGYDFMSYKWYKNDVEIGSKQYYSAGDKRSDLLDETSFYHAEMIDKNGVKYTTCKEHPVIMGTGIKVYPNPVAMGATITIELPVESSNGANINLYSLGGLFVKQVKQTTIKGTIEAPTQPGMYILKVDVDGGVSESIRMIVR